MSRIGKKDIIIPEGTTVEVKGNTVKVVGKLGTLEKEFADVVTVTVEDNNVKVTPKKEDKFSKAMWGTVASHISNMIEGVNKNFEKKLIVEGIGYKANMKGNQLELALGFSHLINLDIPEGLTVTSEKNVITVSGTDKEKVGLFASVIRLKKKPEPYKGKGIRYENEVIIRKEGKKNA